MARLLDSHTKVSTVRRSRSQGKIFHVLQSAAEKAYNALRSSLSCACPNPHGVNYQLFTPYLMPHGDCEILLKRLDFQITLAYDPRNVKGKGSPSGWVWNELSLRMAGSPMASSPPQPVTVPIRDATKKRKRVTFAKTPDETQQPFNRSGNSSLRTSSATITLTQAPIMPTQVHLYDLCEALGKGRPGVEECYGYITDPTSISQHKFAVYPLDSCDDCDGWSTVSLHELLQTGVFKDRRDGPQLSQQLDLAATIASSMLQLHGTPWIPSALTSKNLYFIRRNGVLSYDRVYVSTNLSSHGDLISHDQQEFQSRAIKNPTVFAIGVLLIELILCECLEDICPPDPSGPHRLLSLSNREKILSWVECAGTELYRNAVKNCLQCNFAAYPSLDDEKFREEVYIHAVAPLEDSSRVCRPQPMGTSE